MDSRQRLHWPRRCFSSDSLSFLPLRVSQRRQLVPTASERRRVLVGVSALPFPLSFLSWFVSSWQMGIDAAVEDHQGSAAKREMPRLTQVEAAPCPDDEVAVSASPRLQLKTNDARAPTKTAVAPLPAAVSSSPPAVASDAAEEEEFSAYKSLHVRRDWYSTAATFIAGGVAGAASRTLTAPLDRIKLIVQEGHLINPPPPGSKSAGVRRHPSLVEVARVIRADGGWKSFWRGNVINCFKAGPEFAIIFSFRRYLSSLYEDCVERETKRMKLSTARLKEKDERSAAISRREKEERESMMGMPEEGGEEAGAPADQQAGSPHPSSAAPSPAHLSRSAEWRQLEYQISREASIFTPPFNRIGCLADVPRLVVNCVIGAAAGVGAQSLLYPLEVVKTRAVVSRSNEFKGGFLEIVRVSYRNGGIREFYRGFVPNMVGIVVYRGLEMGIYSSLQQSVMLYRMQAQGKSRHDAALNSAEVGVVGMFASIIAQTVSYPLNVVRTRLQTQGSNGRQRKYNGMIDCVGKMVRNKGVASLFSGLTANYLKAVPASACTFIVFEWVQQLLVGDS